MLHAALSATDVLRVQARADKRHHTALRIPSHRKQIEPGASDLELLLPEDHRARLV